MARHRTRQPKQALISVYWCKPTIVVSGLVFSVSCQVTGWSEHVWNYQFLRWMIRETGAKLSFLVFFDSSCPMFMAAICNRAGRYIFALWFLSSSFFFFILFSLALSHRPQIGCLPYFHTWCGPDANVECRSDMCCTQLAGNTGCKKSPFWHHHTTLSGYIFRTKACIDNPKKNLLNSNTSSTGPDNMVNFGLLAAEIVSLVLGTLQISTGFASCHRYCTALW